VVATRCYLDWNATVPTPAEVARAVEEAIAAGLGNPSSAHAEGRRARLVLEEARESVAELLGAAPGEVVFTSGGSEGNAAALWGLAAAPGRLEGQRLLISAVEHPGVAAAAAELARLGVVVETIPVLPNGRLDLRALDEALERRPGGVVAVQLANSETGVLQDIPAVVERARAGGARVHCDAVQGVGKVGVAARAWGVDTLAMSGHKIGATPGVGVLVVRDEGAVRPLIPGTQERHRRGGTENVPGIAGLGVAARLSRDGIERWTALADLRDRLEGRALVRVAGTLVYGGEAPRLANTSCLGLPHGMRGGAVVAALDLEGFAVSAGPACSSGVERPSQAVEAMGFGREAAQRTLRVSLGPTTREADVFGLVEALERVTTRLKGVRGDRELSEL
jgi:cysteine desulfurase